MIAFILDRRTKEQIILGIAGLAADLKICSLVLLFKI